MVEEMAETGRPETLMEKWEKAGVLKGRDPLGRLVLDVEYVRKGVKNGVFEVLSVVDKREVAIELTQLLGRLPTELEIQQEGFRREIIKEILPMSKDPRYQSWEAKRKALAEKRAVDFPAEKDALTEFRNARVEITEENGVERLTLYVKNANGVETAHHVMTNEEGPWLDKVAALIVRVLGDDGEIFIGGLGLALLNKRLKALGVDFSRQTVAELNPEVVRLISQKLEAQYGNDDCLNIIDGDFKAALREAKQSGKKYRVIMIDAYPNEAGDVNQDASNEEVLRLAWDVLEEGGTLTFYPDSFMISPQTYQYFKNMGVLDSAMHYEPSHFEPSGDGTWVGAYWNDGGMTEQITKPNMAVVQITKPKKTREQAIAMLDSSRRISSRNVAYLRTSPPKTSVGYNVGQNRSGRRRRRP